ncbi:MAG: zinc-binding dehydrogenase [Pseudonocardia sp.]|nr:zinc-binding dehydrogenase [Pseudonocardia sp.]
MKAVTLTATGGPEVLRYEDVPDPTPADDQVVVRVRACGVCGHDTADRAGLAHAPLPTVLGHEVCGEVVEVGAAVRAFRVGDLVAGKQFSTCGRCLPCRSGDELSCAAKRFVYGGGAEYAALDENTLLAVPDGTAPEAAAITACAVGTCLRALEDVGRLRPGETAVITGAGGGLGLHAVQVAAALGARVIALTSSADKADLLGGYGAAEVVVSSGDTGAALLELTGGRGAELVLDNVGHPDVFSACFKALARRGRYVLTGQLYRQKISLYPAFVFFKEAVITGSGSTLMSTFMRAMDLVASGAVRGVVQTFSLAEAHRAHQAMEDRRVVGRAVLVP